MFKVIFSKHAAKSLKKLPSSYQIRIKNHILLLQQNPFKVDLQKLAPPYRTTHRSRLGPYRLFLEINIELKEIIVAEIHRRTTQTYK